MYWFTLSWMDFPAGDHDQHPEKCGQQDQRNRKPVDTQAVVNIERLNPRLELGELHRRR